MSPTTPPPVDEHGYEYRRQHGRVVRRRRDRTGRIVSDWSPVSLRYLAEAYPVDSALWAWLRSLGVRRPGPSGGTSGPSAPRAARARRSVEVTLSDEAHERLDELARQHGSRSAAVEALVLAAE